MTIASAYKNLLSPNGPWATVVTASEVDIDNLVRRESKRARVSVHVIRGQRCRTKSDLLHEWAAALQFPSYFGDNWDAFEDCLTDLEWLSGSSHIVAVTRASSILARNAADWKPFAAILQYASGEARARKGMVRMLFQVEEGEEEDLRRRFQNAGITL